MFTPSPQQREVLGLPDEEKPFAPHEFVPLLGRAQLIHDIHAGIAASKKDANWRTHRTDAGVAESVVVGVLTKVVELGGEYDAALYAAAVGEDQVVPIEYEWQEAANDLSPILLAHHSMAAARRIYEVRQAQEQAENPLSVA